MQLAQQPVGECADVAMLLVIGAPNVHDDCEPSALNVVQFVAPVFKLSDHGGMIGASVRFVKRFPLLSFTAVFPAGSRPTTWK